MKQFITEKFIVTVSAVYAHQIMIDANEMIELWEGRGYAVETFKMLNPVPGGEYVAYIVFKSKRRFLIWVW